MGQLSDAVSRTLRQAQNQGLVADGPHPPSQIRWQIGGQYVNTPDPRSYLGQLRGHENALFPRKYKMCRGHGDLHSENILVDEDTTTWLIDFEHTGWGPILQDAVELDGDIESLPFLEAIRQFRKAVGRRNVVYVHVTLVPWIPSAGEMKTKPTQHSVKELRSIGIQPDILVCRSDRPLPPGLKEKMSEFCDVPSECVITCEDARSIYEVPLNLEREGMAHQVLDLLQLEQRVPDLTQWATLVDRLYRPKRRVEIAIVGKYVRLSDAYLSVVEALRHAAIALDSDLQVCWINSEDVEVHGADRYLKGMHGILVPGGFGSRGIDGKIAAIEYAREQQIPFLGLCLGMQCSVIEWARHIARLEDANSAEFESSAENPVINLLPEQQDVVDLGGTMRLGLYPCRVTPDTLAFRLYQDEVIYERHRHRYEFNNAYRNLLIETGYVISGTSPDGRLVEMIELPSHPFFIASQFHPEFQSRPSAPHPLFKGFVQAALGNDDGVSESLYPSPEAHEQSFISPVEVS